MVRPSELDDLPTMFICEGCHQPFEGAERIIHFHKSGPYTREMYVCKPCSRNAVFCSKNINGIHGEVVAFNDMEEENFPYDDRVREAQAAVTKNQWNRYGACVNCKHIFFWEVPSEENDHKFGWYPDSGVGDSAPDAIEAWYGKFDLDMVRVPGTIEPIAPL